ncbi:MAG: hypothetical protein CO094_05055 [Anaerolineae bacterium CG_4_9_14_3_um_filter_57_17]|nr:hypothetical protein [bacterium]NCT19989.1 hypothetical protein [bacterium]OIO87184.1 MAG: hypothetical protein AUK01_00990 [Anaerolineae bacterium CG2_30_57_67]PJB67125.1 MAG: hypothetical protein CO094_05055 [Anaerolineae bacterium CG_4_9_14_3_um_filter_57_17]
MRSFYFTKNTGWDVRRDLFLLTSDRGNLEDLSTRRHTANPAPLLLVGPETALQCFDAVENLTQIAKILGKFFCEPSPRAL